jgi:hypothetical protein
MTIGNLYQDILIFHFNYLLLKRTFIAISSARQATKSPNWRIQFRLVWQLTNDKLSRCQLSQPSQHLIRSLGKGLHPFCIKTLLSHERKVINILTDLVCQVR